MKVAIEGLSPNLQRLPGENEPGWPFSCICAALGDHSQVSHAWRNLALGSPHLWGRVIDLNEFTWLHSRTWADEVVRRAGTASSLWIRGTFTKREIMAQWFKLPDGTNCMREVSEPHYFPDFFFQFVTCNWSRVERFVVTIGPDSLDPPRWSALLTLPSPNLREFMLSRGLNAMEKEVITDRILFKSAPRLTKFTDHNIGFNIHVCA